MIAAMLGYVDIVITLHALGADINKADNKVTRAPARITPRPYLRLIPANRRAGQQCSLRWTMGTLTCLRYTVEAQS